MPLNQLFGLNGTCTCDQDCVHGYGTQSIVNLIFQEFQVFLGLSLWQTMSYAGRPQVSVITFLHVFINLICLKHNENARTYQGKKHL